MNNDGGIKNMTTKGLTEKLWASGGVLDQVDQLARELGWEHEDQLIVKIAGTRVSGIHQTEEANPKWAPPFGDVRHNSDAQIVVENLSRRDLSKSKPLQQDVLDREFYEGNSGQLFKTRELETLQERERVVDTRAVPWYNVIDWIRKALSK